MHIVTSGRMLYFKMLVLKNIYFVNQAFFVFFFMNMIFAVLLNNIYRSYTFSVNKKLYSNLACRTCKVTTSFLYFCLKRFSYSNKCKKRALKHLHLQFLIYLYSVWMLQEYNATYKIQE